MLSFPLSSAGMILRVATILALASWAVGQQSVVTPTCVVSTWNWTKNSLGQDPCQLAGLALTSCTTQPINITSLQGSGFAYTGPSSAGGDTDNLCKCNSVFYSLISACAGCQGGNWAPYGIWTANCDHTAPTGTWPSQQVGFPKGAAFPAWTFQLFDNTTNIFNNITAFNFFQNNKTEITTLPGPPTSTGFTSAAPSTTSTGTSQTSSGGSHAGAIAGGVVGGVVGAALLIALGWWLLLRKRRRIAPSSQYLNSETNAIAPAFTGETIISPRTPPRYYDPSDPSTFPDAPSIAPGSMAFSTNSPGPTISTTHQPGHKPMSSWGSGESEYRGLPEV